MCAFRFLKDANAGKRIAGGAPVYLAAVLEYLTAEVMDVNMYSFWLC